MATAPAQAARSARSRARAGRAAKSVPMQAATKSGPRVTTTKRPVSAPSKVSATAAAKSAKTVAVKPASPAAPELTAKTGKSRTKLVRDSFTMPQADFDLIDGLKERALGLKRAAKKSELLRAGLHALRALDDAALLAALGALMPLKPGRPKKAA